MSIETRLAHAVLDDTFKLNWPARSKGCKGLVRFTADPEKCGRFVIAKDLRVASKEAKDPKTKAGKPSLLLTKTRCCTSSRTAKRLSRHFRTMNQNS